MNFLEMWTWIRKFSRTWWNIQVWKKIQQTFWKEIKNRKGYILDANLEIGKDISLTLILKDKSGIYILYYIVDSNNLRVEISSKKRGQQKTWEIEDCGISKHLYWGFKKISCKACFFLLFASWWLKRITTKSSIFFHP